MLYNLLLAVCKQQWSELHIQQLDNIDSWTVKVLCTNSLNSTTMSANKQWSPGSQRDHTLASVKPIVPVPQQTSTSVELGVIWHRSAIVV